jgi:hypothetical protein
MTIDIVDYQDLVVLEIDPDAEELTDRFVALCKGCAAALAALGYIVECENNTGVFALAGGHSWDDILALNVRCH